MRDHSSHISGDRHQVVGDLLSQWVFTRETETVPVSQADGRVCARNVVSLNTLPNTRTSNMDAIAVHFDDFENGEPDTSKWVRGVDWQFCNTGVAVPKGFDTALRIEDVEVSEDASSVKLKAMPAERYADTTEAAATLQPGDLLVKAGEIITPVLCAVLNMGGHTQVEVIRKPKVVFIPTGNELVDAGGEVPWGKNVESNGAMICAKLNSWGAEAIRYDIVPDDQDKILAALQKAVAEADIVAINAGSSKGSDDWTCEILEREAKILYHEVNQAPGRHCSFAVWDGKPVIGVSGPPIGAEFTAEFYLKPFVDAYLGANMDFPPTVPAVMLDDNPMGTRRFPLVKRVKLRRTAEGGFVAWTAYLSDRPALRYCSDANALVTVGKDQEGWEQGQVLEVELRSPYTLPPLYHPGEEWE